MVFIWDITTRPTFQAVAYTVRLKTIDSIQLARHEGDIHYSTTRGRRPTPYWKASHTVP